ncbi:hypothetical protein VCRA219O19_20378 [Vibrio crassostreae]|nr:hypothetical protein VCRA219O19_20378 [Vibrio crassostreae]
MAFRNNIRGISITQVYAHKYWPKCTTKMMKAWVNKLLRH